MSHTPGPWKWVRNYCGLYGPDDARVLAYADYEGMWVPEYEDYGVNNARLIAAAPELLEALKLAAEAMEINGPYYFDESETAGKIRAAIAKAEGK